MELATDTTRIRTVGIKSAVVVEAPQPTPEPAPSQVRQLLPAVLVAACLVAGVSLRGYCYARNPSLWIDEAMLALNVVHRTPPELLEPLDLNQGAPVGYLLLSKAVLRAGGSGEYALRLVSLVAALAGVAVFTPLAYRVLPLAAARIAVGLFALSPYLVGYAAEFKQYELDATIAAGLMAVGLPVWRGAAGRGRLAGFAAAGAVAVWFSHPAVFVLGGLGAAALADAVVRRDRSAVLARLAVVGAWVASFGLCYVLFTRKLGMNPYLLDYWAGKFMPLPPYTPGHFAWLVNHFFEFLNKPVGLDSSGMGVSGVGAVCFLVGALALARADWRLLVAVVGPLVLALVASGLKKYPFANRLLMFAVPAAVLLVGYGAGVIAGVLGRSVPGAGGLVVAVLFVAPVAECRFLLKKPTHAEDAREMVRYVHEHWRPGDKLYVYYGAVPAFCYYHPHYPIPTDAVTFGVENRGKDQRVFQHELAPLKGQKRVWVILAHRQTAEDAAVRAYLDGMGRRDELVRMNDAAVLRYDLTAPPAPPDPNFRTAEARPQ